MAVSPEKAAQLARLANGNVHAALTMMLSEANQFTAQWVDWLRKAYQGNAVELVNWVERFSTGSREQQKHFLRYGLHYLRELQQMLLLGDLAPLRLQTEELETAKKLVAIFKPSMIFGLTELLNQCFIAVERNANPKMLFLDASLQINAILRGVSTS
jgi:DNA polymerase-3 subunit delta'